MKALAAIFFLVSGAAMACEPAKMSGPYGQRISLGNCAFQVKRDEWSAASLSAAEDLGHGFVLQELIDGDACGPNEHDTVVQDCSTGDVAVFGDIFPSIMDASEPLPPSAALVKLVRAQAAAGNPISIADLLAEAREFGTQFSLKTTIRKPIAINGITFPLGCGCRTLYPKS